jgi:PAS domain-containing protein
MPLRDSACRHLNYHLLKHTYRRDALVFGGKMAAKPYTADDPETRLALFDFAFENAPIGIALVDLEGRIIRSNSAFAKLL